MRMTFIILGFFYAISQAILIREFLVIFLGNEIMFGIVFSSWFFWIGVGGYLIKITKIFSNQKNLFIILQLCLPILLLLEIICIRSARSIGAVSSSEIMSIQMSSMISFIVTMPCSIIMGMLFPIGCKAVSLRTGFKASWISALYIYETIGFMIGGVIFTLWFAPYVNHITGVAILGIVMLLNILWFIIQEDKKYVNRAIIMGTISIAALIIFLITPIRTRSIYYAERFLWNSLQKGFEFIAARPSKYQYLAVGKRLDQYVVLGDGVAITYFPEREENKKRAGIIMAQNRQLKRALVVGGGLNGFLTEMLQYPIEHIDYVELDPAVISLIMPYVPEEEKKSFADNRVALHMIDARRFLQALKNVIRYDAVIIQLPDPSSAYLNRFYTIEFFSEIKNALNPHGFMCTSVLSAENYFGPEVASYAGSIYHTLKHVFPYIAIAPGDTMIFFASSDQKGVTDDAAVLKEKYDAYYKNRGLSHIFKTVFPPERIAWVKEMLHKAPVFINYDMKPITYYFNMLLWSHFSGSEWVRVIETIRGRGIWIFLLPLMLIAGIRFIYASVWVNRAGENTFNAWAAIGVAGFVSMALQIILIFLFQSVCGFIYERISLVTALFMAGLACGAWAVNRYIPRIGKAEWYIHNVLWIIGVFVLSISFFITKNMLSEQTLYILFFISGLLTGSIFPLSVYVYFKSSGNTSATAGMLVSADHGGAMAGALITGSLMVPLIGIRQSCIVIGMSVILTALIVLQSIYSEQKKQGKYFLVIITGMVMIVTMLLFFKPVKTHKKIHTFTDNTLSSLSGSAFFEAKQEPFPYYVGYRTQESIDSIIVDTKYTAGHIKGYIGPMSLLLAVSPDGNIRGVRVMEWDETPSYVKGVGAWLNNFKRINTARIFPISLKDVDTLTRATVTIEAIIAIINTSLQRIQSSVCPSLPLAQKGIVLKSPPMLPRGERQWDQDALKKGLAEGSLSSKEALFYRKIKE